MRNLAFLVFILLAIPLDLHSQLVSDIMVNTDSNFSKQRANSRVSASEDGKTIVVVWVEQGSNKSNIFCQIFDEKYRSVGGNFRVNEFPDSSYEADVSVRKDGSFGVVWRNRYVYGDYYTKVFLKIYNKEGLAISGEIVVNDANKKKGSKPRVVSNTHNQLIVAFQEGTINSHHHDIYFQIFDSAGNKIGSNVKVNDSLGGLGFPDPITLCVNKKNKFVISWLDSRDIPVNLFCQFFTPDGLPIGGNAQVNDIEIGIDTLTHQLYPDAASDSVGNFVISFTEDYDGVTSIMYQRYDTSGTKIGNNKTVQNSYFNYCTGISSNSNSDIVLQTHNGNTTLNIRINKNDNVIGNYFYISNELLNEPKGGNDILIVNNNIVNIWRDYRYGALPQVFLNVRSYYNPDSTVNVHQIGSEIPIRFELEQNYPNPFNSITNIKFQIINSCIVILKVFDILGREVKTLVNEYRQPGTYQARFNAEGLSSGVYFIGLTTNNEIKDIRKIILMK